MPLRLTAEYCENCRRVGSAPYTLEAQISVRKQHHTVVRRFCSLPCISAWASNATKIARCPGCCGTGYVDGFQLNGACRTCRGEGTLAWPRGKPITQEQARKRHRAMMRTAYIGLGKSLRELESHVELDFEYMFRPDPGETDNLEDEKRSLRRYFPLPPRRRPGIRRPTGRR